METVKIEIDGKMMLMLYRAANAAFIREIGEQDGHEHPTVRVMHEAGIAFQMFANLVNKGEVGLFAIAEFGPRSWLEAGLAMGWKMKELMDEFADSSLGSTDEPNSPELGRPEDRTACKQDAEGGSRGGVEARTPESYTDNHSPQ